MYPEILKITKEDILRILMETKKKSSLKQIESEAKAPRSILSQALEELAAENLVEIKKGLIGLTRSGKKLAGELLKKHLLIESYFRQKRGEKEAHQVAHLLEHYISGEVIRNIKKLSTLKEKGVSLIEFKQKNGLITDIILGIRLFERIISMGIFPGEKIKIINEIPNGVVIEVKNKKFVLAKEIAKEIRVLEYEKS